MIKNSVGKIQFSTETPLQSTKIVFAVLMTMLFSVFLVGNVSALELNPFAEVKIYEKDPVDTQFSEQEYNEKYGVIKISDTFLWIQTDKLAEYSLTQNTDYCWFDCKAQGKVILYKDGVVFEGVKFNNKADDETQIESSQFYILQDIAHSVRVINQTEIITHDNESSYLNPLSWKYVAQTKKEWVEYNGEELPSGKYEWKLEGKKHSKQSIDWIASAFGNEFDEWALWEGTELNVEIFTSDGTFNKPDGVSTVEIVVLGAGGGGGSARGAGGGAGGLIHNKSVPISGNVAVTIGDGGAGGGGGGASAAVNGENSSFGSILAIGGGRGANGAGNSCAAEGSGAGGSGGAGAFCAGANTDGAAGLQEASTDGGFGKDGGDGHGTGGADVRGGGGGGTNTTGENADGVDPGRGGFGNLVNGTTYGEGGNGTTGTTSDDGANGDANSGDGGGGADNAGTGGTGGSGIVIVIYEAPTSKVDLLDPAENSNFTNNNLNFSANITLFGGAGLVNVSLFIDGVVNQTNSSGIEGLVNFTNVMPSEGNHNWTIQAFDNITGLLSNDTRNLTIDSTVPLVNFSLPVGDVAVVILNQNITINWTLAEPNADSCIILFAGLNRTVTCTDNTTSINVTNVNQNSLIFFMNDTLGNENSTNHSWNYLSTEHSTTFVTQTFETAQEVFSVNITTNGTAPTSASLIYNGTEFTDATITIISGNNYNITKFIDIPLINGQNTPFHFNYSIGSLEAQTSTNNQIVNLTTFVFCENGQSPLYINFTFKNETVAEEVITAEIDTTWNFWLGSGSVKDSLTFSNTTENNNYGFCLTSGGNRTLTAQVNLTYDNSISQLRSFTNTFVGLTNTTTTQELFLLPTAEGIFVTFQVVDPAEQVISGVSANVTKEGNLIASGVTDAAGLITYFLDPDTSYVFSFSKAGLTTVTTTLVPTQTSFTIIMGQLVGISEFDTTRGISYSIRPSDLNLLNNTLVTFNVSFNSTFYSLEQFGFVLKNSTGTVFNITLATTETGGILTQVFDTSDSTSDIIMELFWTITGNQTNVTKVWLVFNSANEGFSILTFFNDLTTFTNSGLFGLTDFGLGIIIFLIILVSTGVVSLKFGITSPPGISIIVFSLVAFFDVALNIMPNPVGAIPNFPTIFVGFIFLSILYSEVIR